MKTLTTYEFKIIDTVESLIALLSDSASKALFIAENLERERFFKTELRDQNDVSCFALGYKEMSTMVSIVIDYLLNVKRSAAELEDFIEEVSKKDGKD